MTNRANRTVATVARQLRTLGKPSPKLLQEALRVAGYTPEDALVVGDCLDTDIAAAAAAGIPSCLVPSNAMYGEIMLRYLSEAICRDRDFTGKFHLSGASAV